MVMGIKKWFVVVGASALAIGVSAACSPTLPSVTAPADAGATPNAPAQVAPTAAGTAPNTTRTPAGTRPVAVTRESITETAVLDGVVAAQDMAPVSYDGRGNVVDVKVNAGDSVKKGDVLLVLEAPHHYWAEDIAHELEAAQVKLQGSQANLDRAIAEAGTRQQQAAARAASAAQQRQQAIDDAAAGLRHAQDNLAKVQAGPSVADRQAAQDVVDTARAALGKAQDAYDRLVAGPDPDAVRTATRDVTNAQVALAKAQSDYDTLTRGPDASAVRDAQAQLQRAQTQLQIVQAANPDPKLDPAIARLQHDQAVQDAQLAVDNAQAALVKLKLPPADSDVQAARQRVQDAQDTLSTARSRVAAAQSGADRATLDAAQSAVDRAQQAVVVAQAHARDVTSHPTPGELSDAQDQVRKAQAALDNAQNAQPGTAADPNQGDLTALQTAVAQDQAAVDGLQQTLDATQMRAPFDGIVVSVRVKSGDSITSAKPVFMLARPGPRIVRVDLADDQVPLLSVGQQAIIGLDGADSSAPPIDATVLGVTRASADGTRAASADLQVSWPDGQQPRFGLPVQVRLTLQQKDDVLVVPVRALHQVGSKATVEVLNGTLRRLVNVQVGIKTDTSVEIVSGLTEGQMVLVGPG